jgi:DNA-binding transcriptional LysR family regulator
VGQKSRVAISEVIQNLLIFPDHFTYELFQQLAIVGNAPNPRTWILPNPLTASDLAQQGQGIAVLPEWAVVKPLREGTLVKLAVPGFEITRARCAFWDANRPLTWTGEVFLSLLAADIESQANPLQ